MGILRTGLWMPSWAAESREDKALMWKRITDRQCYDDVTKLTAALVPWVCMMMITMPCVDFSSSGNKCGHEVSHHRCAVGARFFRQNPFPVGPRLAVRARVGRQSPFGCQSPRWPSETASSDGTHLCRKSTFTRRSPFFPGEPVPPREPALPVRTRYARGIPP